MPSRPSTAAVARTQRPDEVTQRPESAPQATHTNLLAKAESVHKALIVRWGAIEVKGLDPKRAEAIKLQPSVHKVGHMNANPQKLPQMLRQPGVCARYIRRTSELLLHNCERWHQIEVNTREVNKHYRRLLKQSRVKEEAYRIAAEVLHKMLERPSLLNVWAQSCPQLLISKTRELELQPEVTH